MRGFVIGLVILFGFFLVQPFFPSYFYEGNRMVIVYILLLMGVFGIMAGGRLR